VHGAAIYLVYHGSPILAILVTAAIALLLYRGFDFKAKPSQPADSQAGRRSPRFAGRLLIFPITLPYLDRLQGSLLSRRALRSVLASFVRLLAAVAISFGTAVSWPIPMVLIVTEAFASLRFKVDILWVVLAGAAISTFVL
jgi:hypothetical protein